jgi:hypothetical protein
MPTSRMPAEEPGSFAAFLALTRPKTVIELSDELRKLVGKVRDTGKKGTLTLTVTISPVDDGDVLAVNDEIKVRAPEHARKGSLAWADSDGNLTNRDPNTMPLFDEDLRSPAFSVDDDVRSMPEHDARVGEIKEPPTA